MRRTLIALFAALALTFPVLAWSGGGSPSPGIGKCVSGQVVTGLNASAPPTCATVSGTVPSGTNPQVIGYNGSNTPTAFTVSGDLGLSSAYVATVNHFTLTSNASAGGFKMQNLGAGAANGDALSYGQSGALLNGLNLNSNQVSGLPAASASGQALEYGQSGAALGGLSLTTSLGLTSGGTGTASPSGVSAGTNMAVTGSFPAQTVATVTNPAFNAITGTGTTPTLNGMSVGGRIDVTAYGATGNGTTDDTAAVMAAIAAGTASNSHVVYFPPGNYKITSTLNAANLPQGITLEGPSAYSGGAGILFDFPTNDSGIGLDLLGSDNTVIHDLSFSVTSSHAPQVEILMGKSTTNIGIIHHWHDVQIISNGNDFGIYNYGGEQWNCANCSLTGAANKALIELSAENTAGITSPDATFATAPTSMTVVHLEPNINLTNSDNAPLIQFDPGTGSIGSVTINGYGKVSASSATAAGISDIGTSAKIQNLDLDNFRYETPSESSPVVKMTNEVDDFKAYGQDEPPPGVTPSVPEVDLEGSVIGADIAMVFGDGAHMPNPAIKCASEVFGVYIIDQNQNGGAPQVNSCSGAIERYVTDSIPVFTAAGATQPFYHIVSGTAQFSSGTATVTLTGKAAFTVGMNCTANETGGNKNTIGVNVNSVSSITFDSSLSTDINFFAYNCIGY